MTSPTPQPTPLITATAGGILAAIFAALFTMPSVESWLPQPSESSPIVVQIETLKPDPRVHRAAFFDVSVQPAIEMAEVRNREAADRCIRRIGEAFDRYREGVDPFVSDLTSLSTRMGIVRRMPSAWWYSDSRTEDYISTKFEQHLFSEVSLTEDIAGVLDQFSQDIDANQRRMLTEVQASLSTSDLPSIKLSGYRHFFTAVADDLVRFGEASGTSSVANFAAVMVASEVGSQVFVRLTAGLLSRFALSAAVGAATTGTASAGGAATGAGAGTLAGPVGTVVGLGVGLAVGLVIDWWMTEKFQQQMSIEMNDYLSGVEAAILDDSESGLKAKLPQACDSLTTAYRERFYQQIVGG